MVVMIITEVNIYKFTKDKDEERIIEADRIRLSQAISNLLDNTIKFTKEEQGTISDVVEKKKDSNNNNNNKEVVIVSKDTGSGIDSDIFPRLLEKFTSKSSRGTGLGLFI
jgi:two-component system, OmpR family, sensor histidine kinase VicK